MLFATVTRSMADILEPVPAVPQEDDMKTSESVNTVPLALPLASPERSSLDEEHFNVSNHKMQRRHSCQNNLQSFSLDGSIVPEDPVFYPPPCGSLLSRHSFLVAYPC